MQARSLFRVAALMALCLTLIVIGTTGIHAAESDDLDLRLSCRGVVSRGGSVILDRDNTGEGRESFSITAIDGNGNVILDSIPQSSVVGGRLMLPPGVTFHYTREPVSNPILVQVVSDAGNGFEREVIFSAFGTCDGLPNRLLEILDIIQVLDGRTSPSVNINAAPPRPDNPQGLGDVYGNVLIVDRVTLNIRSGPGIGYTVVGQVEAGVELFPLGRNDARTWWYVQVGDVLGWVNAEHTFIRGDLTDLPVVNPQGEPNPPRFVLFSSTLLRVLPVSGTVGICELPGNLEYYVVGRTLQADWYEIEAVCDDTLVTGWVSSNSGAVRNTGGFFIPVTE